MVGTSSWVEGSMNGLKNELFESVVSGGSAIGGLMVEGSVDGASAMGSAGEFGVDSVTGVTSIFSFCISTFMPPLSISSSSTSLTFAITNDGLPPRIIT